MQSVDWKIECRNLVILLSFTGLVGGLFGFLSWGLFAGCVCYIAWVLFQLHRIQCWLDKRSLDEPPESRGLWGDVLDGIYRLQRRSKEERGRLQAELDYLQDSFASLADGAVMIDQRGNIEWSNRAAEFLLGLRYPDDKHQQLVNLIRTPEFIHYFEADEYQHPLEMVSTHNKQIDLQITLTRFGKGSRLLFARDITHTNRLQQMRKDFVANVSHELRTPLTVINGYLETAMDNGFSDDLRWRRAVEQMLAQSHRMENLVKDLIILSRLESVPEAVEQEQIDVHALLAMIREEVLAAVKAKRKITIECQSHLDLLGHSVELRSAFTNLIMNAAKYTQDGGVIHVRWFSDNKGMYLEVTDDGLGVDAQHLPRLTERFYRVDESRSADTGGTGLGLAIAKHSLLHHQATLLINSVYGEGSTFTCVFPLHRSLSQSNSA
ncbi:MAG: phosphate regulon sensor histidine kinase PhoR [Spongiibacteraceae bacterium]|nr:phosphate regulon sensor histidine kinase PhoR [Spongiibacteraceae bacterium]